MLDVLEGIANFIYSIVGLIITVITSLVQFLIRIPKYTLFLIESVNVLPGIVIPFCVMSISIYAVLLIIGRQS